MGGGTSWPHADEEALRVAWSAGTEVEIIGEALGRTPTAVRARARKLGLPPRVRPLIGGSGVRECVQVNASVPPHLLPAKGKRSEAIRAGLELLLALRDAGIERTPAEIVARLLDEAS